VSDPRVISLEKIKVACQNCSLASFCLPLGLKQGDIEKLDQIVKRSRPIQRGEGLFHIGEPFQNIYAVKTGSFKTFIQTEDGGEQVLGFHLPGELIGLDAILDNRHGCSAKALETSSICKIPFNQLEVLSTQLPSLQHQIFRLMSNEISKDTNMLMLLGNRSADERLATFLLSLSRRLAQRGFSATEFNLSMSRHDIASYLGLAVETVSRLFTRMQQDGLLKVDRKFVRLLDMERLDALCEKNPHCHGKQLLP